MGLLSILATLPFLIGVVLLIVAIGTGWMSFWLSTVVLTVGSSAVPSGKLASSFSSSSFDARAQLRAAGAKHGAGPGKRSCHPRTVQKKTPSLRSQDVSCMPTTP